MLHTTVEANDKPRQNKQNLVDHSDNIHVNWSALTTLLETLTQYPKLKRELLNEGLHWTECDNLQNKARQWPG